MALHASPADERRFETWRHDSSTSCIPGAIETTTTTNLSLVAAEFKHPVAPKRATH